MATSSRPQRTSAAATRAKIQTSIANFKGAIGGGGGEDPKRPRKDDVARSHTIDARAPLVQLCEFPTGVRVDDSFG